MDLSELGLSTGGVWTRSDALALLTPGQVRAHLACGAWQVLLPGVYADGGHEPTPVQRALAAVLASGRGAVACGRTAARVWRLPLIDDAPCAQDVAVPSGARAARLGPLRRHRLTFASGDVVRLRQGLVLTSPVRTLVDCARLLPHEALVCAVDDALHRQLITADVLTEAAARRRTHPGAPALRAAAALADGRAESPAETLARLLLLPVLPDLVPQVRLVVDGRVVARFDLADVHARFAVEVDGARGHAGLRMVARDRRRDAMTERWGWRTERVTWAELRGDGPGLRRRVVAAHARHLARRVIA